VTVTEQKPQTSLLSAGALAIHSRWQWLRSPAGRWIRIPLIAFIVTRAIVILGIYATTILGITVPVPPNEAQYHIFGDSLPQMQRWDANWYMRIAKIGYAYNPDTSDQVQNSVVLFPLFPVLLHVVNLVVPDLVVAGILLSNSLFLASLILLYRFTEILIDSQVAGQTVFYIAAFPSALAFTFAYSESLYLLLCLSAAYFGYRKQWGRASLAGILASATRLPGVLVMGLVGLQWLNSHGWSFQTMFHRESWLNLGKALKKDFRSLLLICLIPSGLVAFMTYTAVAFGEPFATFKAQADWGATFRSPIDIFLGDIQIILSGGTRDGTLPGFLILTVGIFVLVVLMVKPIWQHIGEAYAVFVLASMVVAMTSTRSVCNLRYAVVLFPVFMMFGLEGRRKAFNLAYRIVCFPLLFLFTVLFTSYIFIG
jgi:mannosyltransferase PIG-V